MVVAAQLSRLGCTCDVAVDGEEALQRLSATRYELVLMDCMLPGISGFEATRRWRAIEAEQGGQHVPIGRADRQCAGQQLRRSTRVGYGRLPHQALHPRQARGHPAAVAKGPEL